MKCLANICAYKTSDILVKTTCTVPIIMESINLFSDCSLQLGDFQNWLCMKYRNTQRINAYLLILLYNKTAKFQKCHHQRFSILLLSWELRIMFHLFIYFSFWTDHVFWKAGCEAQVHQGWNPPCAYKVSWYHCYIHSGVIRCQIPVSCKWIKI